ncbi:MAG TPA: NADH-quinone oxidoreductase subunit C [Acidobacteriaceae bacterium]|jgi:Ni,Fe-hydrogenase III large subunit/Ni,Fe-hydrogenase III component G
MPEFLKSQSAALPANIACTRARLSVVHWQRAITELKATGATFLTLWGADDRDRDGCYSIHAAFLTSAGVEVLSHPTENVLHPTYPSLAPLFPAAARMERATRDLLGLASTAPDQPTDQRPWLRHDAWPAGVYPLRRDFNPDASTLHPASCTAYPFVTVEGDGVHEIAVGPVHAGTIEPGHFRFSVVGEKVIRLEQRLGYTHKGVAKRFESLSQSEGHRLAARISGDTAVAFSWAYCAALEALTATVVPARVAHLRAVALEHERLANHLGDLGALGNDAGFAFGLTQFSRLKEDLLRFNLECFGSRYLLNYILPGGVAADLPRTSYAHLVHFYRDLEHEVAGLRLIYDEHGGLQDRFREAGRLTPAQAEQLGAIGLAARASGIPLDLRADHPWAPYNALATQTVTETTGDVAARVQVRFGEINESLRLCRALLADLSHTSIEAKPIAVPVAVAQPNRLGLGVIEAWRGPVVIALEAGPAGSIRRCHAHDPSWQNWPLLEYAILGNIVPDFPLINKSFNLSYSGADG